MHLLLKYQNRYYHPPNDGRHYYDSDIPLKLHPSKLREARRGAGRTTKDLDDLWHLANTAPGTYFFFSNNQEMSLAHCEYFRNYISETYAQNPIPNRTIGGHDIFRQDQLDYGESTIYFWSVYTPVRGYKITDFIVDHDCLNIRSESQYNKAIRNLQILALKISHRKTMNLHNVATIPLPSGWKLAKDGFHTPQIGEHYYETRKDKVIECKQGWRSENKFLIVKRDWTPPASCPPNIKFQYNELRHCWDICMGGLSVQANYIYSDFTPPPYSPYTT